MEAAQVPRKEDMGEETSRQREQQCKGPEVEMCWGALEPTGGSMTRAKGARETGVGITVKEWA